MDTTAATAIGGTIAAIVQFIKIGIPNLAGARALAVLGTLSALAVAAWAVSQPVMPDRTWTFGLLTAWANIALSAAGAYGLLQKGENLAAIYRPVNAPPRTTAAPDSADRERRY